MRACCASLLLFNFLFYCYMPTSISIIVDVLTLHMLKINIMHFTPQTSLGPHTVTFPHFLLIAHAKTHFDPEQVMCIGQKIRISVSLQLCVELCVAAHRAVLTWCASVIIDILTLTLMRTSLVLQIVGHKSTFIPTVQLINQCGVTGLILEESVCICCPCSTDGLNNLKGTEKRQTNKSLTLSH